MGCHRLRLTGNIANARQSACWRATAHLQKLPTISISGNMRDMATNSKYAPPPKRGGDKPWAVFKKTVPPVFKHKMISLFCGCGGLDLGFRQAGFDIVWANDIDANACETYKTNLGDVVYHGDINKINFPKYNGKLDMLSACFPCQPFSNAGSRRGNNDDRDLNKVALKAVKFYKPTIAIFENVRGMLSVKNGNRLVVDQFCQRLSKLGYDVYLKLVDASQHRVAQQRLRVFIIAVCADRKTGHFSFPLPKARDGLTIGEMVSNISARAKNRDEVVYLGPQATRLCSLIPPGVSWKSVDGRSLPKRLKALKKKIDRYRAPAFYRRFAVDEISGTVTASFKPEKCGVMHPLEDRPLSVREVARIQSFPDWFAFKGSTIQSKYKQIGNAVPPRLAYEIALLLSSILHGKSPDGVSCFIDMREFLKNSSPLRASDPGVFVPASS